MAAPFIRDIRSGALLQSFLVSAIAAVLLLRLILKLTHYPQLGGGGLHIAHMLWGGVLMLAGIVILLSFIGREIERFAAVIGGIGFGVFIDEVGKFVTSDNDYFFRPAAAIMYVTFILIYLSTRAIHQVRHYSQREYLVNALVHMEDVALHDLDEQEAERVRIYLERSDPSHPLVAGLRRSLEASERVPARPPSRLERIGTWIGARYGALIEEPTFRSAVVGIILADLAAKLAYVLFLVFFVQLKWKRLLEIDILSHLVRKGGLTVIEWIQVGSWLLSAIVVARGVLLIRRSRLRAYRMFEVSILISIFITHVFNFYRNQFLALFGFSFSVLLLISVRYMMQQERLRASPRESG